MEDSNGFNTYSAYQLSNNYKPINSYDKQFGCLIDQRTNVKTKHIAFVDIGKCKIEQNIINNELYLKIDIDTSIQIQLSKKYSYITLPNAITWKGYSINYFLYERYFPGLGAYFTAVEPINSITNILNQTVKPNITLPENSLDKLFPDLEKLEIREIDYSFLGGGGFDFSWFTNLFSGVSLGKNFIFTCKFLFRIIVISIIAFVAILFLATEEDSEEDGVKNRVMAGFIAIIVVFVATSPFSIIPKV